MDHDDLSGLDLGTVMQADPHGLRVEVDRNDIDRVEVGGNRHDVSGRAAAPFGPTTRARFDESGDHRADGVVDSVGLDDGAGDLESGDEGPPGSDLMFAVDEEPIGEVRCRCIDLDDQLTGAEDRFGQIRNETCRSLLLDKPTPHQS